MIRTHNSRYATDDPLTLAMRPPATETEAEKDVRLKEEAKARQRSEKIDEELKAERNKLQKNKDDVRLLLLGQAESGKSTLQKQFQLMYSPKTMETERLSWRTVIYFNIVRSLKQILSTLAAYDDIDDGSDVLEPHEELDDDASISDNPTWGGKASAFTNLVTNSPKGSSSKSPQTTSSDSFVPSRPPTAQSFAPSTHTNSGNVRLQPSAHQIATLRLRLSPLTSCEEQLARRLNGGNSVSNGGEVFVRNGWQTRTLENGGLLKAKRSKRSDKSTDGADTAGEDPLLDEVSAMLDMTKEDILELWEHPTVVSLIARRKLKLDEWSEFFLLDIMRIGKQGYIPTTADILHARIQTMGVAEHSFEVNIYGKNTMWHLYDVGGARGQRHSWVPYFDTANAIIFVAPISAFDQYLEEDPRTNRIDDSLQLFTQICANQLLKKVHLVLFLNKTDVLRAKLAKGLRVQRYIVSFADRVNDYETAVQYFRAHFLQVHRRNNESRRVLYTHLTSVVDTKTTQSIIGNIRDSIFRGYLQSAALV